MNADWNSYSTSDLIREGKLSIGDGYRAKNIELSNHGLPFARVANINNGFHFKNADRFPVTDLSKVGEKISVPGDVVFTSKGTVGRFAYVGKETERFVFSPQLCYWRSLDPTFIFPRYLFYWIQGREFRNQVHGVKGQTDMADFVSLTDQRRMRLTLPPLPEQKAIAHILGALDDKIELNRQMNQTLEAMAQAIFKSWFVDFDPVRAKLNGELYPLDAETLALFPDRFVDSALGPIPEGWEVGRLDDSLVLKRGFDLPTRIRIPGQYAILAASGPSGTHEDFKVKGPGVTTGRSGVLGNVFYVQDDFWPLNTSLWVEEFKVATPLFAYFFLLGLKLQTYNAGSAVPTLNRNHVHNLPAILPDREIVKVFQKFAEALFLLLKANTEESRTLAELRDTLLPKLISGELRVSEVERLVEGAVG